MSRRINLMPASKWGPSYRNFAIGGVSWVLVLALIYGVFVAQHLSREYDAEVLAGRIDVMKDRVATLEATSQVSSGKHVSSEAFEGIVSVFRVVPAWSEVLHQLGRAVQSDIVINELSSSGTEMDSLDIVVKGNTKDVYEVQSLVKELTAAPVFGDVQLSNHTLGVDGGPATFTLSSRALFEGAQNATP